MRHFLLLRIYRLFQLSFVTWLMFLFIRLFDFWWNRADFADYAWKSIFQAFFLGLRFDLSALAHLMVVPALLIILPLPFILDKRRWYLACGILFLTAVPLFVMGWIDIELVRFVKARMTYSTLFLFREGDFTFSDMMKNYAFLIIFALFFTWYWMRSLWRIAKKATIENEEDRLRFSLQWMLIFVFIVACIVIGIRGGIKNSKPLRVVDTYPDLQLGNWALNTPFTFIKELRSKPLEEKAWFKSTPKLLPYLNGSVNAPSAMDGIRPAKKQNVVIFMMESLSLDQMGEINNRKGFTPFMDSLAQKGIFFHETYANASRSIDGVPAVLGGIPAWGNDPFLVSSYANAEFGGLGSILAEQGYSTAFFHGGKKGTMFLDKFAIRAGFEKHYSKEDYPDPADIDTSWGVFDEPYFQYVAKKLDEMHKQDKPFAVSVFSLSAHFPFHIPKQYENTFPEGPIPVLKSQAYADFALRRFFETAKDKPWFQETLFIVTADHGTQVHLEEYKKDPLGGWRIPLIFYHPSVLLPKVNTDQPVQQIDILPSILDFLGIDSNKIGLLGRSLFKPGARSVVVKTNAGFYSLQDDTVIFEAKNGDKPKAYARKTTNPLSVFPEDVLLRGHAAIEFFYTALKERSFYFLNKKENANP